VNGSAIRVADPPPSAPQRLRSRTSRRRVVPQRKSRPPPPRRHTPHPTPLARRLVSPRRDLIAPPRRPAAELWTPTRSTPPSRPPLAHGPASPPPLPAAISPRRDLPSLQSPLLATTTISPRGPLTEHDLGFRFRPPRPRYPTVRCPPPASTPATEPPSGPSCRRWRGLLLAPARRRWRGRTGSARAP
jgi:hypothetical protein